MSQDRGKAVVKDGGSMGDLPTGATIANLSRKLLAMAYTRLSRSTFPNYSYVSEKINPPNLSQDDPKPTGMKAWLYNSTAGGLETNLQLHRDAREPPQHLQKDQVRLRVFAMSLNPVDYKIAEMPLVGSAVIGYPASPGMDFSAEVIGTGGVVDSVAIGDTVFGKLDKPSKFGPLGEIIVVPAKCVVQQPAGVSNEDAATIGVCGLTAYQSIVPFTKAGDSVFINGGSGGTGTYGIQIAKAHGLKVTTSCSTANIQLCKDLGADEVIDYKRTGVTRALEAKGQVFDLVVDNVGSPADLYNESHRFLRPTGRYAQVGGEASQATTIMSRALRPKFLGGGQRPWHFVNIRPSAEDWGQIAKWIAEGKVKPVIQQVYDFEDAPKAYEALKTGRTRGKLVVRIAGSNKS